MSARKRILVVEDDESFAKFLGVILHEAGYDVVGIADNCPDALQIAVSNQPDLAILDLNLSGNLDGITTGIELSQLGVRLIFLTGHLATAAQQAYELAEAFLQKPVGADDLLDAVGAALTPAT